VPDADHHQLGGGLLHHGREVVGDVLAHGLAHLTRHARREEPGVQVRPRAALDELLVDERVAPRGVHDH